METRRSGACGAMKELCGAGRRRRVLRLGAGLLAPCKPLSHTCMASLNYRDALDGISRSVACEAAAFEVQPPPVAPSVSLTFALPPPARCGLLLALGHAAVAAAEATLRDGQATKVGSVTCPSLPASKAPSLLALAGAPGVLLLLAPEAPAPEEAAPLVQALRALHPVYMFVLDVADPPLSLLRVAPGDGSLPDAAAFSLASGAVPSAAAASVEAAFPLPGMLPRPLMLDGVPAAALTTAGAPAAAVRVFSRVRDWASHEAGRVLMAAVGAGLVRVLAAATDGARGGSGSGDVAPCCSARDVVAAARAVALLLPLSGGGDAVQASSSTSSSDSVGCSACAAASGAASEAEGGWTSAWAAQARRVRVSTSAVTVASMFS